MRQKSDPNEMVAIRAAHRLDVATGRLTDDAVICVQHGKIVSVSNFPPPSVRVLDLGDRVLMPGLVDCHTHIFLQSNVGHADFRYQVMEEYPSHRVARAVRALRIALDHGFTTLRDLETEGAGYGDVGLRDALREGILPGPDLRVAGPALSSTGSYPIARFRPDWSFPSGVQVVDGPDDCRRAVREQISYGVDWIKVYANAGAGGSLTADGYIDSPPNWTADEFKAIVDEAHAKGRPVAAHATSDTGVSMALAAGVDTIEHGYSIRPDVAKLMADRGVYLCPTLMPTDHVAEHRSRERGHIWRDAVTVQERSFRNCLEAGVKIVFGTDAGCFDWTGRNQAEEFSYLVRLGMGSVDAIQSATTLAAEMLGSDTIGQLREGATADIIAVSHDPSQDVRQLEQVDFVMRAGKVFKLPEDKNQGVPTVNSLV